MATFSKPDLLSPPEIVWQQHLSMRVFQDCIEPTVKSTNNLMEGQAVHAVLMHGQLFGEGCCSRSVLRAVTPLFTKQPQVRQLSVQMLICILRQDSRTQSRTLFNCAFHNCPLHSTVLFTAVSTLNCSLHSSQQGCARRKPVNADFAKHLALHMRQLCHGFSATVACMQHQVKKCP